MKPHPLRFVIVAAMFFFAWSVGVAQGETRVLHGSDSSFRSEAIGICWAILKTPASDALQVVIRIQVMAPDANIFKSFAVKAVHPFTGAAEWMVGRRALEVRNDVLTPREEFKRLGGRQILFFQSASGPADQQPDMVVEYLGIPDTAPEFSNPGQLENYFAIAFGRLQKP